MYNYDTYIKTEHGMDLLNSNAPNVEIMIGATAESDGKEGLVPAPVSENKDKYLKGDGTWSEIESAKRAEQDERGNKIVDTYANKSLYGDKDVSVGRKSGSDVGTFSVAIGESVEATDTYSVALGCYTKATKSAAFSCGDKTLANGYYSFASGSQTIANNSCSFVCGKVNVESSKTMLPYDSVNQGNAFIVGNGIYYPSNIRSNAFSVMFDGTTKAASTITAATTADYAEFFEWEDGNKNNEDRVGKFVTLHEDKIIIAESNEDYVLGIVSGSPFVLGNGDCDVWTGMWMRDEFNRVIYEPALKLELDKKTGEIKEVFDEDGNLIYEGKRRKLNPDYDPSQKYISRFDRPEWSPIGMLGVLSVIQDGTCAVNGYCCCNNEGIATACDRDTIGSYRVIKKISDQVVRVVFR